MFIENNSKLHSSEVTLVRNTFRITVCPSRSYPFKYAFAQVHKVPNFQTHVLHVLFSQAFHD